METTNRIRTMTPTEAHKVAKLYPTRTKSPERETVERAKRSTKGKPTDMPGPVPLDPDIHDALMVVEYGPAPTLFNPTMPWHIWATRPSDPACLVRSFYSSSPAIATAVAMSMSTGLPVKLDQSASDELHCMLEE